MKHLITLALLSGAAFAQTTVQTQLGKVTVNEPPKKIAVLSPYALDLLLSLDLQPAGYAEVGSFKLGAIGQVVEKSSIPYLGRFVKSNPVYLGTREAPNLESILALKPDLIVGQVSYHEQVYAQLSRIAPTVLLDGNDFNAGLSTMWRKDLKPLAEVFKKQRRAEQVVVNFEKKLQLAKTLLRPVAKRTPRALLVGFPRMNAGINPTLIGSANVSGRLITELGFQLAQANDAQQGDISLEGIPAIPADFVFAIANNENTPANAEKEWFSHPLLKNLGVSKKQRVFFADNQQWNRIRGPLAMTQVLQNIQETLNH
ncbi:ABC transporter substrate-binding protein [Deinococcus hopiensis]|uniref:Iron complex transport system substrate-binding protein n=1 Tax=Deinococcus hopiensis KR-140 TaxID=695939 RepID=A0A1W1UB67_9DEIO|nr:ABC transporter substrate-binding protein [Deinococcus hopiensis]SMB78348.1 iron complex transport system substrate-binding protein [Deinococcus hopiensis KR-140]